jgi:hypothetical protein
MATVRDSLGAGLTGPKRPRKRAGAVAAEHHPKSPTASVEALRKLAGVVALKRPVPDRHFLDESSSPPVEARAGD